MVLTKNSTPYLLPSNYPRFFFWKPAFSAPLAAAQSLIFQFEFFHLCFWMLFTYISYQHVSFQNTLTTHKSTLPHILQGFGQKNWHLIEKTKQNTYSCVYKNLTQLHFIACVTLSVKFFLKDIKEIFQLYYIFLLYTKVTEHEKKNVFYVRFICIWTLKPVLFLILFCFAHLLKRIPIAHAYNV